MKAFRIKTLFHSALVVSVLVCFVFQLHAEDALKVGDKAPDFTLKALDDQPIQLSKLTADNNVVVVVLRGWPGYTCPACEAQVHDLINRAADLSKTGVKILLVYPGPANDLKKHAGDFSTSKGKALPKDFTLVLDPDSDMVKSYSLRWDAPGETSYPGTFVVDKQGVIRFIKISHGHGGRAGSGEILAALSVLH